MTRAGSLLRCAVILSVSCVRPLLAAAEPTVTGEALYAARCGACHSIDTHRTGPAHAGVVGRRAGSAPGFDYSPALAASKVIWSPAMLMAWLENPQTLIPGESMGYRLDNAAERAAIVAFLALKTPNLPR